MGRCDQSSDIPGQGPARAHAQFTARQSIRDAGEEQIDLQPARRTVVVTPCCGPVGEHVFVNSFADRSHLFLTPLEALDIAAAMTRVAEATLQANRENV